MGKEIRPSLSGIGAPSSGALEMAQARISGAQTTTVKPLLRTTSGRSDCRASRMAAAKAASVARTATESREAVRDKET